MKKNNFQQVQKIKENKKKTDSEFYGENDGEKVVVCSVISSGRPEEESL